MGVAAKETQQLTPQQLKQRSCLSGGSGAVLAAAVGAAAAAAAAAEPWQRQRQWQPQQRFVGCGSQSCSRSGSSGSGRTLQRAAGQRQRQRQRRQWHTTIKRAEAECCSLQLGSGSSGRGCRICCGSSGSGRTQCDLLGLGVRPAERFDIGHPSAKILSRFRCWITRSVTTNIGWYVISILHDRPPCNIDITWP